MPRLVLSLLFAILLAGCAGRTSCPEFPLPSPHVQKVMDELAEKDREVWEWGNKLLDLCEQLGTCEKK